jgi:hypothetical protein
MATQQREATGPKARRGHAAASHAAARGEMIMQSEFLLVTFKTDRAVKANNRLVGVTNHLMVLVPGDYVITLDGDGFSPPSHDIELIGTSHLRPMVVAFT